MKRILSSLNTIIALILALVLVQMVCFIALRNPVRTNLSARTYYDLSEKSLRLLDELDQRVSVYVFFQEEHALFNDVENLLEEYQYHSPKIHVEWIDPVRDPARTEKLANQYGIMDEAQVVVFALAGKSKLVRQADLADFQMLKNRRDPTISAFKGEQAFSGAIQGLIQEETPKIYFLTGHGERRITEFDPRNGYSKIGTMILNDNLEIKELMLSAETRIPEDAAALVIPGPTKRLGAVEVEMIEEYLNRSGRVMILLDALKETGLESMLRRWGVGLRNDFVVDPENTLQGIDVHVRRYVEHPITMRMQSVVQFILPRSIMPLEEGLIDPTSEDRPIVRALAQTSDKSWSETQVDESAAQFDADTGDLRGPLSLAVAVERGATQTMLDVQIKPVRMVVFGDSDFVGNGTMVGGNADLFMSALNWLVDREELIAIAPKPIEEVTLMLSRKQLTQMFWINVGGIPSVAAVIGLLVWFRRRK